MNNSLATKTILIKRPHFHLKGDSLYFLISHRAYAQLNENEQAVWNAIDNQTSFETLQNRLGLVAGEAFKRLLSLNVCEAVPAAFPPNRRRVLVIEPHMDDAALSVGGTMWLRRNECEFIVLSAVGISNYTNYYSINREYFDFKVISALRKAESSLVAGCLGGQHLALEGIDAPLRYQHSQWTREWFNKHHQFVNAHSFHPPRDSEHIEWARRIAKAIAEIKPEEIWMPLGVGQHVDHELTRNACLHILTSNCELFEKCPVKFYLDVPYAGDIPCHIAQLVKAMEEAGARLNKEEVDISGSMAEKLHLISIFGSQFKIEHMRPKVEKCAGLMTEQSAGFYEIFYRLVSLPTRLIDPIACYAEKDDVLKLVGKLKKWLSRNRSASQIKFLMLVGVGRWAEDMNFLLDIFPKATLQMHISRPLLAEAESFTSPKIVIRAVAPGSRSWLGEALNCFLKLGPVVIVSGRKRERIANKIGSWAFGFDVFVVPALHHLVLALRIVSREMTADTDNCGPNKIKSQKPVD